MGHAVQVVVIGHDRGASLLRELDQLHVDLGKVGHVFVDEFDVDQRLLLQEVEHLESTPAAVAPKRIARVGDVLQLGQHEVRHEDLVTHKAGLGNVHDPSVDDDAGIQENTCLLGPPLDQPADAPWPEDEGHHLVAAVEAERHTPVGEDEGNDQRDHEAQIPGQLGQEETNERRQ